VEKDPLISIVMATMIEAKPFVMGMSLKEYGGKPFPVFRNDNIRLVISGIGKANAAMASAYCCREFNPSCICNLGAAGAVGFSHPLGEIFHITKIFEHDRPKLRSDKPMVYKPHVLDGFQNATLSTGDRAITDPEERMEISRFADLVDMEGAAVVQACRIFETKCYLFKFVSDTPEHTNDDDIIKHIRTYRGSFYDFFLKSVLEKLLAK
jgi:adenosylhomocysteine nucleosidase